MDISLSATLQGYPDLQLTLTLGQDHNHNSSHLPDIVTCRTRLRLFMLDDGRHLCLSLKFLGKHWRYRKDAMCESAEVIKCDVADLVSFSVETTVELDLDQHQRMVYSQNRLRFVDEWVILAHLKNGRTERLIQTMGTKSEIIHLHQLLTQLFIRPLVNDKLLRFRDDPHYQVLPSDPRAARKKMICANQVHWIGVNDTPSTTAEFLLKPALQREGLDVVVGVDKMLPTIPSVYWTEPCVIPGWVFKRKQLAARALTLYPQLSTGPGFSLSSLVDHKMRRSLSAHFSAEEVKSFDIVPTRKLRLPAWYKARDGFDPEINRSAIIARCAYGTVRPLGMSSARAGKLEPVLEMLRQTFGSPLGAGAVSSTSPAAVPFGAIPQTL